MSRTKFLDVLRVELVAKHDWAKNNPVKVDHWINLTRATMETSRNEINIDGPAFLAAWRAVGGRGRPTFKGLRALPA